MGLSVANILLEVTGDESDGERALADMARDLALFGREEAEAAAYVDTTEAKLELDELKTRLSRFSAADYSAEVNLRIAKAQADLTALQAELKKVDGEDVDVDIDVKRGVVERVGALSKQISDLGVEMGDTAGPASIFVKGLGSIGASLTSLGPLVISIAVLLGTTLVAALAALLASLTQAVGGLGALGIAFGASLVPGVLLAIGAIAKFSNESDKAGTAAYALAGNFKDVFNTFKNATAGGANAVFQGLSDALRDLDPLVDALGPAFTRLGEAGGDAFRLLAEQFSSPEWQHFFVAMTNSLATLTPLFAESFGAFATILAHIAQASMPFLIAGMKSLAGWLVGIGERTSNIHELRGSVGGLVDQLGTWLDLTESIGGAFLAFVRAAAPAGQAIAEWIGDVADRFREWADSEEGRARIQSFFRDVLPAVKELLSLLGNVGKLILQITQFFAPLITLTLAGLNKMAGALSDVIDWLMKVDRALAFNKWGDAFEDVWNAIKGILSVPIDFILNVPIGPLGQAADLWKRVKQVVSATIDFVLRILRDPLGAARDLWRGVKGVVTDAINFVLKILREPLGDARDLWRGVKGVITDLIEFVMKVPRDPAGAARDLWQAVKGIINDAINFVLGFAGDVVGRAKDLWNKVKDAVAGAIDLVVKIVPDVSGLPGKVLDALGFANGVNNLRESMFAMVGERGPELAFLPQGTDIYTAGETRSILKALARGVNPSRGGAPAESGGGGRSHVTNNYDLKVVAPGTGSPDPDIALALWDAKLRAKGVLAG